MAYHNLEQYGRALKHEEEGPNFPSGDNEADGGNSWPINVHLIEQAISDYAEAIKLNPEDPVNHLNIGNAYLSLGKHEEAINSYTESIKIDPNDARSYYSRGFTYSETGKTDEAEKDFERAKELGVGH